MDGLDALVEPTGCVVTDKDGRRWHRMRVRFRRRETFEWFSVSDSRADVAHALQAQACSADLTRDVHPMGR